MHLYMLCVLLRHDAGRPLCGKRVCCRHNGRAVMLQSQRAEAAWYCRCVCSNEAAVVLVMKGADPVYQLDLRADPPCIKSPRPGSFTMQILKDSNPLPRQL